MYAVRKLNTKWWCVGFLYSDGRFDPVAYYEKKRSADSACDRMNSAIGRVPL
jgi:hypothetical protein